MADKIEIERKYEIPDRFRLPDLSRLDLVAAVDPAEIFRLDAIYYDTADLQLASRRVTLRRRHGGHDAGWHIKRPVIGGRRESHYPATDGPAVSARVDADVQAITRGASLAPIARVRTRRQESAVKDAQGAVLALIAVDKVRAERLLAPPAVREWRELEVELVDGAPELLDAIQDVLEAAGARPAANSSKLAQTMGDAYPDEPDPGAGTPAGRALANYLREQRDALLHNDPLVRAGDVDGVHDMRVATRRLRSTLATFRQTLAGGDPPRAELKWLAELLGAVRDRDVLIELIVSDAARALPRLIRVPVTQRVRDRVGGDQKSARLALARAMGSARYWKLLDQVDAIADQPPSDLTQAYLFRRVSRRLRKADRLMERANAPAETVDEVDERDTALHEARKAYKKARYAVELVASVSDGHADRLVGRVKKLQEALGDHQDGIVAADLMKEIGDEAFRDGINAFPYGLLSARQRAHADVARIAARSLFIAARKRNVRSWLD